MRGVRKVFGGVVAVRSIDLEIAPGEIVGIIGPSGSGKTTTIRLMLGIYRPTEGAIRVFGRDPARFRRRDRERIGYLPQHFVLYPDLTVSQNLAFVAETYGMGWISQRRRVPEMLRLVQLDDAADRLARDISGGMQRRLELASALVHDPALLVLDEPTAGLDPVLREEVWGIFRRLKERGRSLVVTTQYVTEAEFCDRIVLIDEGQAIAAGTPEELRKRAFGGDTLRLTIPGLNRQVMNEILAHPLVRSGEWVGPDELRLVVTDAREAIPQLTDRLREGGHSVSAIEEGRESFDRVFVELVERNGADGHGRA